MKEDKVYPAFYEAKDRSFYFYQDKNNYFSYTRATWDKSSPEDSHASDKNITTEYLANTYGEVESKEHAEFIVKLAEVNGIYFDGEVGVNSNYFCFFPSNSKQLTFWRKEKDASKHGSRKQITIPLPPELNVNTSEEDFEMKQIAKNNKPKLAGVEEIIRDSLNENGDNLIFGDADKCKEWPCVGSKVQTSDGVGVVKLMQDVRGYYVVSVNGEYYQYQIDELSKPKTPEEKEIEEDLVDLAMCARNCGANDLVLAKAIMTKYKLTKKPQ